MTANRVALCSRVSTHHGQDPELQPRELREYAQARGLTIVQEYTDVGFSGSKDSRPALNQLKTDARRRRFDSVLVWKIDRWGRSLKHLVTSLAELDAYGVEASWRAIAAELGVGVGTVHRISQRRSKIPCGAISLNQSNFNPAPHILCGQENQDLL
jgi:resolvase-like protein